ncbi:MAG TPA: DUF202 domain-containing protein [Anaerolineae bacterium]|nr:DUF202 domain-containing protein [Anaerolineae bacterium]HPL27649.1 DUF202 domain-containing protein [Anaerolineae bacterium]
MGDDRDIEPIAGPESRARTHLANERTFLAWFRAAVALVALGLAAAQFLSRGVVPGVPLTRFIDIAFVAGGVFAVLAGARRYYRAARQIEEARFQPATYSIAIMTVLLVLIAALAIAFIVLLRR